MGILRVLLRLISMAILAMGWLGVTVVVVGPMLAFVVFVGRCTGHSRRYWRWVVRRLASGIFWWKRVRVSGPASLNWEGVTDGVFSCVSVVDILSVLRLIPHNISVVYQPVVCPWWLVMIFEKCGVYPVHMVPEAGERVLLGVVPPDRLVSATWEPATLDRWLESPAIHTACIRVHGTNSSTDWRSWLVCLRCQPVTVTAQTIVWPALVNARRRTETRTRQLTEAWARLQPQEPQNPK
ncbi:hypothetical protein N9L24_03315 [Candidatus Marinamargulisbacteria bacterium]|nr:hypothetical protein [Candidatus Marinamargulisbacteria bacterium]